MKTVIRRTITSVLLCVTLIVPVASVAAVPAQTSPSGAAYLTLNQDSAIQQQAASYAASGNGIPGPQSVVDVPEPSSLVLFALGLTMIGGLVFVRRRHAGVDTAEPGL